MSKTKQETSKTKQMRTKEEIMARATSLQGCNVTPDYSPILRSLLDVLIDIRDIQYNKKVYMELKQKKLVIKHFENEQKDYGTHTALFNVIWQIASSLMTDIGVKGIKTSLPKSDKKV